jgi:hypothetical protein
MIKDHSITNLPQMPFIESKKDLNQSPSLSGIVPVHSSANLQALSPKIKRNESA